MASVGPTLITRLSCRGCKYLIQHEEQYDCDHPGTENFVIRHPDATPDWCPERVAAMRALADATRASVIAFARAAWRR